MSDELGMSDDLYTSDDDGSIIDESQLNIALGSNKEIFPDYTPFTSKRKKNTVTAGYTQTMRDILLNRQPGSKKKVSLDYVNSLKSVLLSAASHETDGSLPDRVPDELRADKVHETRKANSSNETRKDNFSNETRADNSTNDSQADDSSHDSQADDSSYDSQADVILNESQMDLMDETEKFSDENDLLDGSFNKKEMVNGHVLRKRKANQYHIFQVDKLNYDKITERMLAARYEHNDIAGTQQENQYDYEKDYPEYEDDLDEDVTEDSFAQEIDVKKDENHERFTYDSFFYNKNQLGHKHKPIQSLLSPLIKTPETTFFDDSGDSDSSTDVEEVSNYKKSKQYKGIIVKSEAISKNKLSTSRLYSDWGPIRSLKKKEDNVEVVSLSESVTDSKNSSDSDASEQETYNIRTLTNKKQAFKYGFSGTSSNSIKYPNSNLNLSKNTTRTSKNITRTLKNTTTPSKNDTRTSKNIIKTSTNATRISKNTIKTSNSNTRGSPFKEPETQNSFLNNETSTAPAMLKNKKGKQKRNDQSLFFQDHLEVPIEKGDPAFLQDAFSFSNQPNNFPNKAPMIDADTLSKPDDLFGSKLLKFLITNNKSFYSPSNVSNDFDFLGFLNGLLGNIHYTVSDYDSLFEYLVYGTYNLEAKLTQLEELVVSFREHLMDPRSQTTEKFISIFFKSGCIPLLCFQAMMMNNNNKKADILNKMINYLVRFINNFMKVNGDVSMFFNNETRLVVTFVINNYSKEFQKVIDYYSSKSEKYKKLFYKMVFLDLETKTKINNIKLVFSTVNDVYTRHCLTLGMLLKAELTDKDKQDFKFLILNITSWYLPFKEEQGFEETFIFSLRNQFKKDSLFVKSNTFFMLIMVLYKNKSFFELDDEFNRDIVEYLRPGLNFEKDTPQILIRKINMCVLLIHLNYQNFILVAAPLIRLLQHFSFSKSNLCKIYKNIDIETTIYKDCFDQCFALFLHRKQLESVESDFFHSLKNLWVYFYDFKWNLLGEQLVTKPTVDMFAQFIAGIYSSYPQRTLYLIKVLLMNSINIDDHHSPIYKFCINTIVSNKYVDAIWIKNQIYDKLFMFFKSCDSIETYIHVIARLIGKFNIEIFDFKGYKQFFKGGNDLLALDYYMQMSAIKVEKQNATKILGHIFAFIKKCLIKWISNPRLFKTAPSSDNVDSNEEKLVNIIKNYLVLSKGMLLVSHSLLSTVPLFLEECSFNDFMALLLEIDNLVISDSTILRKILTACKLDHRKRSEQLYLNLLLKNKITDQTNILNKLTDEFRHADNLSQFIDKISQNETGFSIFIDHLLSNDIKSFAKVYSNIKIPQLRYKVDLKLITYLQERCMQVTFNEWDTLTALATTNPVLNKLKTVMVSGTVKENKLNHQH